MAPPATHNALTPFENRIEELGPISDRARANLTRALALIDPTERDAFIHRHRDALEDVNTMAKAKYADFPYWAYLSVLTAQWLGLDRSEPLDILDIGMGPGSFVMVARSMGHRAVGTDVSDPWYEELCTLAGSERVIAPVERGKPYTPLDRRFDLITIMLPAFHRRRVNRKREYWSVEDWRVLLSGLTRDVLMPEGAIFIMMPLDKDDEGNLSYSPLVEWARERGAILDKTFSDGAVRHILFDPATAATFAESPPTDAVKSDITLEMPAK